MKQATALGILKTGRNVYLTGAAGSGKTHVLRSYIDYLLKHNVHVGITASTGIAATHLGGMTIHSWSGIGIKDYLSEWDLDALTQRQALVKRLEKTSVLIIDEVSMLRPEVLDMVDQVAQTLRRNSEPFGGMQLVLSGDFFQLPPVVRGGTSDSFADMAHAWHAADFRTCYLDEQHRQKNDPLLSILNDIRDGTVSEKSRSALLSRVSTEAHHDESAVVLATHNSDADARNSEELAKIHADTVEYEMISAGRKNIVEALKKSVLAPETLELKVGAKVMFVKNNTEQGYVNGTLGTVVNLSGAYPEVQTRSGEKIVANPVTWETVDDGKILGEVTQVPLRLAWAITIHKSQGMSLDSVEVDLSRAFTPGQGYVALSRARTLEGLVLRGMNTIALEVHPYVCERDIFFQEESQRWEKVFLEFSSDKVTRLQKDFLEDVEQDAPEEKIPTHFVTLALIQEGKQLREVATERGLTLGTVVGHLEKCSNIDLRTALPHIVPDHDALEEIKSAFEKTRDIKLAPVYKKLGGAYSFDELRIARLFL